jgi:DUF3047 family protein
MTPRSALAAAIAVAAIGLGAAGATPIHEDFEHGLSPRWKAQRLGRATRGDGRARVAADPDGNHFLEITTADAFYAIGLRQTFAVLDYDELSWRWRVRRLPAHADIANKGGDDAAARLYVVFGRRSALHPFGTTALVYVWDDSHPPGAVIPNPYAPENEKAIVKEGGAARLNQWVSEHVDLARDYRQAFGESPPKVEAIVCASDSDDTHSASEADFDDISVSPEHRPRR